MADIEFTLDKGALADLVEGSEGVAMLQAVGDEIAALAADKAPKRTGQGAASIQAVVSADEVGPHADISWDRDHFYMGFAETGTEHEAARPFLRPALDETTI